MVEGESTESKPVVNTARWLYWDVKKTDADVAFRVAFLHLKPSRIFSLWLYAVWFRWKLKFDRLLGKWFRRG